MCVITPRSHGFRLIPNYAAIGIWAPIILVICRVIQGLGLGGEWGGSVLLTYEYAPKGKEGLYASVPQIGLAIGLLLAAGIVALLSSVMGNTAFEAWGWRIGFALSALLVFVGLYIRLKVRETPAFEAIKKRNAEFKVPFRELVRRYPGNVLKDMGARYVEGVFFNIFAVFSIVYLTDTLKVSRTDALIGVMAAAFVMLFCIPYFASLSDRLGRTRTYFWGCVIIALSTIPAFWLMHAFPHSTLLIGACIIIPFGVFYAIVYGTEAALFCELFDAQVRYSGISFVYQFSGIVASGLTPLIATALLAVNGGQPWLIVAYTIFTGIISAGSVWLIGRSSRPVEVAAV